MANDLQNVIKCEQIELSENLSHGSDVKLVLWWWWRRRDCS